MYHCIPGPQKGMWLKLNIYWINECDSRNIRVAASVGAGVSREGFPRTLKDRQNFERFEGRTRLGESKMDIESSRT